MDPSTTATPDTRPVALTRHVTTTVAILVSLIAASATRAQDSNLPKYEFRGAWIATVLRLDWPPHEIPSVQREHLIAQLDSLKRVGINAVFFQVRSEADAMYESDLEPWSYWLTGEQGRAPNPKFDPLEFAIEESHKRGMELHAWFNPYRAIRGSGYANSANHVSQTHFEWMLGFGAIQVLDPGLPEVRDHIVRVIADVATRYDIDGVHFDDYFYPYPPNNITGEDALTFSDHPRGFSSVDDWRRDNINLLIQAISDTLRLQKPFLKFGVAPFGIWKNGVPTGIVGLDAYSVVYADPLAWLDAGSIDYLVPQLYWAFGGGQDYGKLAPWWADKTNGRHLYAGHGAYRADPNTYSGSSPFSAAEVPNQIRFNRSHDGIDGSVFFRAKNLTQFHSKGLSDSLSSNFYRHPALTPTMAWKDQSAPAAPESLTFVWNGPGELTLSWDGSSGKSAGTFKRYTVYRVEAETRPDLEGASQDPGNLIALTGETSLVDRPEDSDKTYYYFVRSASSNSIESDASNVVEVAGTVVSSEHEIVPAFELYQNYPNPFSPGGGATALRYRLDRPADVLLELFDATGRLVHTLARGHRLTAGNHTAHWDGKDATGRTLPSGSYFYSLEVEGRRITRGLVLVR